MLYSISLRGLMLFICGVVFFRDPARADDYYLPDGRAASLSGLQIYMDAQMGGRLDAMKCLHSFMIIESKFTGGIQSRSYAVDLSALAEGRLRYLLEAEDSCTFDTENRIDTCQQTYPDSQETRVYHGLVGQIDPENPDVVLYRTITDAEWSEYKVTGQLPISPIEMTMQLAMGDNLSFQFPCDGQADISNFLVDNPTPEELQELRATYKTRYRGGPSIPFTDAERKKVIEIIGSQ
jgi:hypothetical protein